MTRWVRTRVRRRAGSAAAAMLAIGTQAFAQDASPESKALNHASFVSGTIASCQQACQAGSGPFVDLDPPMGGCDLTCDCVGEQLGARINGDDLWQMYLAKQSGAKRAEAMTPYLQTMAMGYKVCGFPVP